MSKMFYGKKIRTKALKLVGCIHLAMFLGTFEYGETTPYLTIRSRAKLNESVLASYLRKSVKLSFLEREKVGRRTFYMLTEKGIAFQEYVNKVQDVVDGLVEMGEVNE